MPIYEYYSPDTHKIYQFLARSISQKDLVPRCPDGDAYSMQKKVSNFSYIKGAAESGSNEVDMDDPKVAGAMTEMEREMSQMDPESPDPQAMGAIMEKMSALTGEELPEDMQEMVGRMKAGEDLESIEEKFEDMMDADGEADESSPSSRSKMLAKKLLAYHPQRNLRRDPKLYEMEDWI